MRAVIREPVGWIVVRWENDSIDRAMSPKGGSIEGFPYRSRTVSVTVTWSPAVIPRGARTARFNGLGAVPVAARIGGTGSTTPPFPWDGAYLLPTARVRRAVGPGPGIRPPTGALLPCTACLTPHAIPHRAPAGARPNPAPTDG